jgi:putative ABC transport system substrate-binding protein
MKRRSFLAAALLPAAAAAQPPPPLVGVLRVGSRADEQFGPVFGRDMARLGWEDGKTYRTQTVFADGEAARLPALAGALVKDGARVIVAFGNAGVAAAQKATRDIPIVGMADDLAGAGLVSSMARPGGNTTGVSIMGYELDVKRLEVLHEIVPQARKIGVVVDQTTGITGVVGRIEEAAAKLGLTLAVVHAGQREQIAPALARLTSAKVEAVDVLASAFLNFQRATFIEQFRALKLPAMYEWPESVEDGGLASYGPRISLCFRHVAVLTSKVLRGAKPADLPIEQPTTFVLAINAGAAHAIGLTLPEAMLLRADAVVD